MGSKLVERVFFRNQRLIDAVISRPALFLKRHLRLVSASVVFAIGLMMVSAFSVALIVVSKPMEFVEDYPLRASIELEKQGFRIGENVTVTCRLKNTSNEPITVNFGQDMWQIDGRACNRAYFNLVVINEKGEIVYSWNKFLGAMGVLVSIPLGPGEELSNTFVWGQRGQDLVVEPNVEPGEYFAKANVAPYSGLFWIDHGSLISLETPLIAFEITQ